MPILYALLAALTGLSLGGAVEVRADRPAVSVTAQAARPVAASATMAARTVAALRPVPSAPVSVAVRRLGLIVRPLFMIPARRRE